MFLKLYTELTYCERLPTTDPVSMIETTGESTADTAEAVAVVVVDWAAEKLAK